MVTLSERLTKISSYKIKEVANLKIVFRMKNVCLITFVIIISLVSCIEEFKIDFPDNQPKLVVEGVITNQPGPYYVRLTLSKATFADQMSDTIPSWLNIGVQPVLDAMVIISDDKGVHDTLVHSPDSVYYYHRDTNGSIIDSAYTINPNGHFLGYYQTTKIKGEIGNTYHLKIEWQGQIYVSTCYMPPVPDIDSVTYTYSQGKPGKDDNYVPRIWFKDNPNTKDYYLFWGVSGVTKFVVLSDEFINSNVSGLDIFKGVWFEWWMDSYPQPGMFYKVELHSITKEIYDYYNDLIMQVKNDGGVYTPAPASPPSNISNGALGYFRASAVQVIEDILPY